MGVLQRDLGDGSIQSDDSLRPRQDPEAVLAALALPRDGEIFDLDAGRWPGMPILDVHPPYVQTTYRTARGAEEDGDLPARFGPTAEGMGVITELVSTSCHAGPHTDALCHITTDGRWFGGHH